MKAFDIFSQLKEEKTFYDWAVRPGDPKVGCALRMINHPQPWSIKHTEFDVIYETIVQNNLKCGYEVATAFGISALAAGLAFKQTGGKLVTMDAYVEEHFNDCSGYTKLNNFKPNKKPDGLKSVEYLINKFELQNNVFPEIGWSPNDTKKCIEKHFDLSKTKIDFVFIDAGHWDDAVIKDIDSIREYISDDCFIFFHDIHCFTDKFFKHIENVLKSKIEIVVPMPLGFNLSKVVKI